MKKDNFILLFMGTCSLIYYFKYSSDQVLFLYLGICLVTVVFLAETVPYILKINRFANAELKNIDSMSGIDFEEYVAFLLDKHGYEKTKVTQAQSDQGIDIITKKDSETIGIQCKRWKRKVGNKAIQEVYSGIGYYTLDKAIVVTNSYFTDSAKELAAKLNVELWDRNKLIKLIKESKTNS
ncbi:restriction endonuclease [Enterococcus raffinosus]|uniref:restriction endonuclease n=1 Tax=Enterococcus raffinosus TaxID=71452 RepID=UPI00345F7EB8